MLVATSTSMQTVSGHGSTALALPVAPIAASRRVRPESPQDLPEQAFNTAFTCKAHPDHKHVLYGPDAKLRQSGSDGYKNEEELSETDRVLLEKLRARDAMVRWHEAAHMLVAGGQADGLVQYTYQTGPDGRPYAIGGSVKISIISSPTSAEDAANQADTARRAAMANGTMSLQDMLVAMRAAELSAASRSRAFEAYASQTAFERA